ncbi:MAG TPA: hypothetical protein VMX55_05000 [candidate division Zixibacteria bacterium]|nr:hypothetical protein [candidate division Zixibacteria bacterium]
MSETIIKIPGTSFSAQFGIEGKYYTVFLIQYGQAVKSKKLDILKGSPLQDLPIEVEKSLQHLLETENLYINPVIIDRVVNDLLEHPPEKSEGTMFEEHEEPRIVPSSIKVQDLITERDIRAGKTSVVEFKPQEKSKFDASSANFGTPKPRAPRPLPSKESMIEQQQSSQLQVAVKKEPIQQTKSSFLATEEKTMSSTNELQQLTERIDKTDKELKNLKKQVTTLKKTVSELTAAKEE